MPNLAVILGALTLLAAPAAAAPSARALVTAALDAMGGEAKLRAIRSLHFKAIDASADLETPSRPEPPWPIHHTRTEHWLDFARGSWRRTSEPLDRPGSQPFAVIVDGGIAAMDVGTGPRPGNPVHVGDAAEQLLYHPFRLVLAAADAADLHRDGTAQLAGQPTDIVAFHAGSWPVRLWLDARTHRLAAAEITHALPDDYFWRVRGDIRDRLEPSRWTLDPSGVWFARQYDITRSGVLYDTFAITELETAASADRFAIPDAVRAAYRASATSPSSPTAQAEQPVVELAPGIWFAGAAWANALLVGQPTGPLLIDAPISERYTARSLDELAHRFGAPAAVVLTDQYVPSLAGLREVAARGIPLRALDANTAFVASLLAAPHRLAPDTLARAHPSSGSQPDARTSPRSRIQPITQRTVVGTGPTRIELIPMRTTLGERVLLAWFPAARLLWTATALERQPSPSRLAELAHVIAREHLSVDRVVGSRLAATPWATLQPASP